MPRLAAAPSPAFYELALAQADAISRSQAIDAGVTPGQIEGLLAARRWQSPLPGVYLTFTGPMPPCSRVWGALLYGGVGATACSRTAAWLWGLRPDLPPLIEICVSTERRVIDQRGLHVSSRRHLEMLQHPVLRPLRTRIEETVLDLVNQATSVDEVVAQITGACQRRLTTADRLGHSAANRKRLRWRTLVEEVLADVVDGVQSALERHYLVLERAHGLPAGVRNRAEGTRGRHRYRDVRYGEFAAVVELDGNAAHPMEDREFDRIRDNDIAEHAQVTLRYGWKSVVRSPCVVATQVGRVLTRRGWSGQIRPCGSSCSAILS